MKKTLMTRLLPLFFLVLACKSPSPNNIENIEQVDSTLVVDERIEDLGDEVIVKEKICMLPSNYFGNWTGDPELSDISCEWGFWLAVNNELISFTLEMEVSGSNGTCKKVKDFYEVEYEYSDEMTRQNPKHIPKKSKMLLKLVDKNLFISLSGKENDFHMMYRCPNSN